MGEEAPSPVNCTGEGPTSVYPSPRESGERVGARAAGVAG
jgi:hypothetical protein